MKKVFLLMAAIVLSLGASAQKESKHIGGNLNFGGGLNSAGLGVKGLYQFEKEWRGEVGLNVYPSSVVSVWEIYGHAHYLIPVAEKVNIYPLAGVGIAAWSASGNSDASLGINVGVGGEYQLNSKWLLQAELKGRLIGAHSQGVLSLGAAYRF